MERLILGIDPGSRRTGFGIVALTGDRLRHVTHGVIQLDERAAFAERLSELEVGLKAIYEQHEISATVVEKIFFGKNADSAFKLGHARGVCLMVSARHRVPIMEYAARYVKKCVTGSGAATKDHVQMVVSRLLGLKVQLGLDASDALALALTYAQVSAVEDRLKKSLIVKKSRVPERSP